MRVRPASLVLVMFGSGCSSLLDADFGDFSEGTLENGTTNLPGAPNGDQMVVSGQGGNLNLTVESGLFVGRHLRIPSGVAGGTRPSVTFRPLDASSESQIFISFRALITGGSTQGRIVFHDLDYNRDSDLTLDFDPAPGQVGDTPVTATGWKTRDTAGSHRVFLGINPAGDQLGVVVVRDGSSSADVYQFSAGGWRSYPPNLEITMTTVEGGGSGSYEVDEVLISENGPNVRRGEVAPTRDVEVESLLREVLGAQTMGSRFGERVEGGPVHTLNVVTLAPSGSDWDR